MSTEGPPPGFGVKPKEEGIETLAVRYEGHEYPLVRDLTEREKFDAERLSGQSIDVLGNYTSYLLLAYFTLRRAGFTLTFDEFLDGAAFEVAEATPPPVEPSKNEFATPNGDDPTEIGGLPITAPSSESNPGI